MALLFDLEQRWNDVGWREAGRSARSSEGCEAEAVKWREDCWLFPWQLWPRVLRFSKPTPALGFSCMNQIHINGKLMDTGCKALFNLLFMLLLKSFFNVPVFIVSDHFQRSQEKSKHRNIKRKRRIELFVKGLNDLVLLSTKLGRTLNF